MTSRFRFPAQVLLALGVMLVTLMTLARPARASCTCSSWSDICRGSSNPCRDGGTDPECGQRCCEQCGGPDSPRPGENLCEDYCATEPSEDDGDDDDGCRIAAGVRGPHTAATDGSWWAPAAGLLAAALVLVARRGS